MKLLLEAQADLVTIEGNDFDKLKEHLHQFSQKYGFNVEIKGFKTAYRKEN